MKRLFCIGVLLLTCLLITIGYAQNPEKVKIGYQKTEIYQHLFVALEKGFFKARKLEVEPVEFASANLMAEALIAGRIDGTGATAFPVIFSIEQNNPGQFKIYIVNAITKSAFPDYILVKKDSKIRSLKELRGMKIGTYPGSTILIYTKIILKHFFDPDKDTTIIQLKPELQLQSLESGQVDAIFVLEPIASLGIIKGIARVLQEAPLTTYVMNPLPGSGTAFSPKFLKEHPKTAEKVKKAMYATINYIDNPRNSKEVKKIIGKWTQMEPQVINRLRHLKYWKLDDIDKNSVQKLADLLLKKGFLEKSVNTSNLYYGK